MFIPEVPSSKPISILWLRRDLRLDDNKALGLARATDHIILPVYIFDNNLHETLEADSPRVNFIHQTISRLNDQLAKINSGILVLKGNPLEVFTQLFQSLPIASICFALEFEPKAIDRDQRVQQLADSMNIQVKTCTDHLIFHPKKVLKENGEPYLVYTPYSRKWIDRVSKESIDVNNDSFEEGNWTKRKIPIPSLSTFGFKPSNVHFPDRGISKRTIDQYDRLRNTPAVDGTSQLSVHLRYGTISIRKLVQYVRSTNGTTFLKELIWREFFAQILYHYPKSESQSFKPKYRGMPWRYESTEFERWSAGQTGVPIVDAGMRQLNATGYMHNRIRMITASYLTKNLLHDWKLGELYFAQKLIDFDLASNVGNWQWVAGTGCDAAPYFRIFNPYTQAQKFDSDETYIKKWVSEYGQKKYREPIIDYKESRERCLSFYKKHTQIN